MKYYHTLVREGMQEEAEEWSVRGEVKDKWEYLFEHYRLNGNGV